MFLGFSIFQAWPGILNISKTFQLATLEYLHYELITLHYIGLAIVHRVNNKV